MASGWLGVERHLFPHRLLEEGKQEEKHGKDGMRGLDKRIRVTRNVIESIYISVFLILMSSPLPISLTLSGFSILYSIVNRLLHVQEKMTTGIPRNI